MKEEKVQKVAEDFLEKVKLNLPKQKARSLFIVGIIGLIGSGKTRVARILSADIPGTVLLKSDSARFLLQESGLKWGDNVRKLLYDTGQWLLKNGYSIALDSDYVDEKKRGETQKLADKFNAKFYIIRIKLNKELSFKRLRLKWEKLETGELKQQFDNYLVITRGKEQNLFDRALLHEKLKSEDVPQLIAEINNNGDQEDLRNEIDNIVEKIK